MKRLSLIALAAILLLAYSSTIVVNQGTEVLCSNTFSAKQQPEFLKPGLHFKIPFFQKVQVIDLREQLLTADGSTDKPYLSVQTFDKQNLELGYHILWRVADVNAYYQAQFSTPIMDSVRDMLNKKISAAVMQLTLVQLMNQDQRQALMMQLQKQLEDGFAETGIQLLAVNIDNITVPASERGSWLERMRSQQQGQLAQLQLQTSTLAQTLKANVDTKIATILTQGQQQADQIRAQANAKAAEIYNQAYQKNPDFYKFYHDLEAYEETIGSQDVLVFGTDNPFFKSLAPSMGNK